MAQNSQNTSVQGYTRGYTRWRNGRWENVGGYHRSYQPTFKDHAGSALRTVREHPRGSMTIAGITVLGIGVFAAAPVVGLAGAVGVSAVGAAGVIAGTQRGARRFWGEVGHPMISDIASTMRKPNPERERRKLRKEIDSMLAELEAKPDADLTIDGIDAAEQLRAIRHHMDLEDIDRRQFEEELRKAAGKLAPAQRQKIVASAGRRKRALELRYPNINLKSEWRKLWGNGFRDLKRAADAPLLPSPEKFPRTVQGEALASWGVCDLIEMIFDGAGQLTRPTGPADITARF